MRRILLVALIATYASAFAQDAQPVYSLTIHITGFRSDRGVLGATVFRNADGWPEANDKAAAHNHAPIVKSESMIRFKLPAGTYSVAVLHDENENRKLDRGFLGIPKEGFGFSNGVKAAFSVPEWQKCAFALNADKTIDIQLQYK